jgi:hypothetical protein
MTTDGRTSESSHLDGGPANERKQGLGGMLERVEERAMDMGRSTVSAIDGKRSAVAETMAGAAGQLHTSGDKAAELGHEGGEKVSHLAHGAADKLQVGADYVRDHDLKAMLASVEKFARSNPGIAMLAAGVVGFLAARAIRND